MNRPRSEYDAVIRAAYPRVIASLLRRFGDFDFATDMTQEAIVKALTRWPVNGLPDAPAAWLMTAARNRAIDLKRKANREILGTDDQLSLVDEQHPPISLDRTGLFEDDLLRLIFTCCHPVLNQEAQVTLTLRTVLGFSIDDIGKALLTSPAAIEKRLTRAKQTIRSEGISYAIPNADELPQRMQAVMDVVYLMFNRGYWSAQDAGLYRESLCHEAIRLGRMLCRLFRRHAEARSLLALMLLTSARVAARVNTDGELVPLNEQNRKLWDRSAIAEGVALINAVYASRPRPGPFQLQAAISSLHCQAASADTSDWAQISELYGCLDWIRPSPVVTINRAVALSYAGNSQLADQLLQSIQNRRELNDYQPFFLAKAQICHAMGRNDEALAAQQRAIELSGAPAERAFLERRLSELSSERGDLSDQSRDSQR